MRKDNKILLGIILILIASILLLQDSRFYYLLPFIGHWSILELLVAGILIYWSIKNIFKKNFMSASFFFTVFLLLNKLNLDIKHISNWKIIIVGFLIGLGLSLVFNGKRTKIEYKVHINKNNYSNRASKDRDYSKKNYIKFEKVFGSSVEYIEPMILKDGEIELVFSNLSLYLDKVDLEEGRAGLNLTPVFSSISIFLPKDWDLHSELTQVGASIKEYDYDPNIEKRQRLVLRGEAVFSSVKIYYI